MSLERFLCVGQIQPRCLSERRRSLLLALAVVAHLNLKFFKKIQIGGTHYGLQQSQIAFSCGSVMYSQKIKSEFQVKFMISGGTIMTIIANLKGIMVGNREFGNFATYIQEL